MVWRIHFTAADLARTRICPIPGPLAETVMALSLLRCPLQPRTLFSEWRSQVGGRLAAPTRPLVPPGAEGVDLYASAGLAPTIEQGLGVLLATIDGRQAGGGWRHVGRTAPASSGRTWTPPREADQGSCC